MEYGVICTFQPQQKEINIEDNHARHIRTLACAVLACAYTVCYSNSYNGQAGNAIRSRGKLAS